MPKEIAFATKGELAWTQIEAALAAAIPRGPVLMDAGYGDEAALRDGLSAHGLPYAVGIKPATAVWWDAYKPAPAPLQQGRGRRRTRVLRDETHQPIGVRELAQALPAAKASARGGLGPMQRPISWSTPPCAFAWLGTSLDIFHNVRVRVAGNRTGGAGRH